MKTGKDLALEVIKNLIDAQFERTSAEKTYDHGMQLKTNSDDSVSVIYIKDNSAESIDKVYNRINERYRDHIVGFEPKMYNFRGINGEQVFSHWQLVFEGEYQQKFYGAMEAYNKAKQEWCDKYGSE